MPLVNILSVTSSNTCVTENNVCLSLLSYTRHRLESQSSDKQLRGMKHVCMCVHCLHFYTVCMCLYRWCLCTYNNVVLCYINICSAVKDTP